MLKITNGSEVLIVSSGAFKSQYKPFGWSVVEEKLTVKPQFVDGGEPEEKVIEKPLSEMTSKELKAKAKELGVDIRSASTKEEARKMLADATK